MTDHKTTITEMREALARALAEIPNLGVEAEWPELIQPPVIVVNGPTIQYDEDMDTDVYTFPLPLYTGLLDDASAQQLLDEFASGDSIKTALYRDPTLGGLVQYLTVVGLDKYGVHEVQDQRVRGCEFTVTARVSK